MNIKSFIKNGRIFILYRELRLNIIHEYFLGIKRVLKAGGRINKKSQKFYEDNRSRIEENLLFLDDEKSKNVYLKTIQYRCCPKFSNIPEYSFSDQYFLKDIVRLDPNEVFLDCGAYIGDTFSAFIRHSGGRYKKYVAIEGQTEIANYLRKKYQKYHDLVVINAAVWDKEEMLSFAMDGSSTGKILDSSSGMIKGITIDHCPDCSDATFIKMDIEGAELNALKGAEQTIKRNHPKLAICIYHSDDDMLGIFEWIRSLDINYRYFIRHHTNRSADTVLYSIPVNKG